MYYMDIVYIFNIYRYIRCLRNFPFALSNGCIRDCISAICFHNCVLCSNCCCLARCQCIQCYLCSIDGSVRSVNLRDHCLSGCIHLILYQNIVLSSVTSIRYCDLVLNCITDFVFLFLTDDFLLNAHCRFLRICRILCLTRIYSRFRFVRIRCCSYCCCYIKNRTLSICSKIRLFYCVACLKCLFITWFELALDCLFKTCQLIDDFHIF